jgi:hypothetical protein
VNGWFDNKGFNTYYLNKSKYAKKQALIGAFYYQWRVTFGSALDLTQNITYNMKNYWTAANKRKLKTQLLGVGHTSAGIDGLFKCFADWNRDAPK